MNFQQLRIIRETVRQNFNLTEVASALFASQSGVSKHIKTYVALGMGVGLVSSLAIDPQRDQNLCVVDARRHGLPCGGGITCAAMRTGSFRCARRCWTRRRYGRRSARYCRSSVARGA